MRRFLLLGLCALAMCGLGGTVAAGAQAAMPAFYECVKVKGGKFKAGCKEEGGKGGFEAQEGIGKGKLLKGTGTALGVYVPKVNGEMKCQKATLIGHLATPSTVKGLQITETGCSGIAERKCTSAGQKERGRIVSSLLEATLGYVDAAERRVGLDLKGEGGPVLFEYECEGLLERYTGSLIGEITPINTLTSTYTIACTRDSEGFQGIRRFEGGLEDVPIATLSGSPEGPASFKQALTFKGEHLLLKG